jgi:hypothetical protein
MLILIPSTQPTDPPGRVHLVVVNNHDRQVRPNVPNILLLSSLAPLAGRLTKSTQSALSDTGECPPQGVGAGHQRTPAEP